MPTGQKSPLHPSALTINGITPGRRIVRFNLNSGLGGEYIIKGYPVVLQRGYGTHLMVDMMEVGSGKRSYHYLADMGVVPWFGQFNPANFVVDHRKRHLLPTELVPYVEDEDDLDLLLDDGSMLDDGYDYRWF